MSRVQETAILTYVQFNGKTLEQEDKSFATAGLIDIASAHEADNPASSGDYNEVGLSGGHGDAGAMYVYKRTPSGEWSKVARLAPTYRIPEFASGVAMAGDFLVTGMQDSTTRGTASMYRWSEGGWWTLDAEIKLGDPNLGGFGDHVAIAGEFSYDAMSSGNPLLVAAGPPSCPTAALRRIRDRTAPAIS
ncbi:hypothetical protein ACHAWF_006103 [Thalassiosira exigua]